MMRVGLLRSGGTWENDSLWLDSDPSRFQLIKVEGLNPPPGRLNWSTIAGKDGSVFESGTTANRNIVITVSLTGTDAEATRQRIYKYFTAGNQIWIKVIPDAGSAELEISGRVDTVENSPFEQSQVIQASIICPRPFFYSGLTLEIPEGAEFENPESVPAGYVLYFTATAAMQGMTFVFYSGGQEAGRIPVSKVLAAGDHVQVRHNFITDDSVTVNGALAMGFLPIDFSWPELEPGKTYSFEVENFEGTRYNPRMDLRLYRAGV